VAEFDFTLEATPLLGGLNKDIAGNKLKERDDVAIVSIAVPQGGDDALTEALRANWGLEFPEATLSTIMGETRAIRTSPDQILLVFPHEQPNANAVIRETLNGAGYTTDQTDNWVVLEISGPDVSAAMERLSPVDLSPETFGYNASARTMMEHMGALVVRTGDDAFWLMSASSSAGSFLHAVETSFNYVTE